MLSDYTFLFYLSVLNPLFNYAISILWVFNYAYNEVTLISLIIIKHESPFVKTI